MIEALKERIKAAAGDLAELESIKSELDRLTGPEARELKIRLINLQFNARRAANPTSIKDVLAKFGLVQPDSRPLHQYQLDEGAFAKLRDFLRARARFGFANCGWEVSALFVLWSAYWFQQKYRGGIRRWEDIEEALGVPFDGNDGRRLVQEGLQTWHRPSVKGERSQQWLRTLAVEGGFPSGILEETDGWVNRYLLRVVAALLETETINADIAFMAAAKEADSIPQAYRQEIFYALAADLAEAIARYRRRAEQSDRPRGLTASEWLDVIEPEWRSKLPISTGAAAAAKLVNG
jgi:hypothetical protein